MESENSSRTAIWTAIHRAAHQLLDDESKILADPFARPSAGFSSNDELLATLDTVALPDFARVRTLFALRNRYAEDELAEAMSRGISQYIILGAGLDSFAYRRPRDPARTANLRGGPSRKPSVEAGAHDRVGIEAPPTLHYSSG
jgi:O-methyltransferase involved in polyketide biosynthesis